MHRNQAAATKREDSFSVAQPHPQVNGQVVELRGDAHEARQQSEQNLKTEAAVNLLRNGHQGLKLPSHRFDRRINSALGILQIDASAVSNRSLLDFSFVRVKNAVDDFDRGCLPAKQRSNNKKLRVEHRGAELIASKLTHSLT